MADTIQAKLDLGISLALFNWPALTLAVQNHWGGSDSEAKREWFAGAISDLFSSRPQTDLEDVETMLLQVMFDEFEVNVEDETGFEVAGKIMEVKKTTAAGNFAPVDRMNEDWTRRKGKTSANFKRVDRAEEDDDTDWDSEETDESIDDVEMQDDPSPRATKEKVQPELDEDGFTKVIGRKKR
jgi:pre-rRNA-processing protein TSR2